MLLGILLILSGMFVALSASSWIAARYFVKSTGFVASAEVLLAGIIAAVLVGVICLIQMFRLSFNSLVIATFITMPAAAALLVAMVLRVQSIEEARRDPEEAYQGVSAFTVRVEQIVVTDPYLRVRMDVDSNARGWVSTGPAPEHQVCKGTVRADQLQRISKTLVALARVEASALAAGTSDQEKATTQLIWSFVQNPGVEGSFAMDGNITFSSQQETASKELAAAVHALSMASASPTSRVRCD